MSGDGVFVNCRGGDGMILPGTLLGLFSGIIFSSAIDPRKAIPHLSNHDYPFLRRYDGHWLDYLASLPYPLHMGLCIYIYIYIYLAYLDYAADQEIERGKRLHMRENKMYVRGEALNPFAYGHKINHPPPGVPANVKLIDFDIPHTFFPSHFMRFMPYINFTHSEVNLIYIYIYI